MSLQDLASFQQRVREDVELRETLSAAGSEELPQKMADLGAEHGFSFTADEVHTMMQPAEREKDLSDEDLERVTGGAFYSFSTDLDTIDTNLRNLDVDERSFPGDSW